MLHSLLGPRTLDDVLSHPVAGPSWEGFAIENLIAAAPAGTDAYFHRTRAGAEIDLVLILPDRQLWLVEVKRSSTPKTSKGFHMAAADLNPAACFFVHPAEGEFPLSTSTTAVSLPLPMERLAATDEGVRGLRLASVGHPGHGSRIGMDSLRNFGARMGDPLGRFRVRTSSTLPFVDRRRAERDLGSGAAERSLVRKDGCGTRRTVSTLAVSIPPSQA